MNYSFILLIGLVYCANVGDVFFVNSFGWTQTTWDDDENYTAYPYSKCVFVAEPCEYICQLEDYNGESPDFSNSEFNCEKDGDLVYIRMKYFEGMDKDFFKFVVDSIIFHIKERSYDELIQRYHSFKRFSDEAWPHLYEILNKFEGEYREGRENSHFGEKSDRYRTTEQIVEGFNSMEEVYNSVRKKILSENKK